MATAEDRRFAEEQHKALTQRLRRLKIQQARYGYGTDPAIDNEIEDLEFSIREIQRQLDGPQLLPEAKAVAERYQAENTIFLMTTLEGVLKRQTKTEETVARIDEGQHAASDWRLAKGPIIDDLAAWKANEERDAPKGRRRNWRLMLFNTGITIAAAVLLVGRALGWW